MEFSDNLVSHQHAIRPFFKITDPETSYKKKTFKRIFTNNASKISSIKLCNPTKNENVIDELLVKIVFLNMRTQLNSFCIH